MSQKRQNDKTVSKANKSIEFFDFSIDLKRQQSIACNFNTRTSKRKKLSFYCKKARFRRKFD